MAAETPETATSTHLAAAHTSAAVLGSAARCSSSMDTCPSAFVLSPQQGLSCYPGDVSRQAGAELPGGAEWN